MTAATRAFDIVRVRGSARETATDCAAAEEPLEIRLHGHRFATIMRTPGADRALAAGFLLSERIVRGVDDIGAIEHCTDRDASRDAVTPRENIVNVTLA